MAALGIGVVSGLVLVGAEDAPKASPGIELKSVKEKASYAIGSNFGRTLRSQLVEIDMKAFTKGIEDGLAGAKLLLTDAEMKEVMTALQAEVTAKRGAAGEKNKKDGEAFLAENAKKPGIVVLPSGLQYRVITEGTGAKPKATDSVTTHYRGTLIDGTEFDSSYARGEPASFRVGGVIRGWTEALQLMPVGSKWELFVPSNLGYAERGSGPKIGPNSTLIFEVELLSIDEQPK
jgi:FKBP-type peptidyl-prolyl cis-trans isomerase FklB